MVLIVGDIIGNIARMKRILILLSLLLTITACYCQTDDEKKKNAETAAGKYLDDLSKKDTLQLEVLDKGIIKQFPDSGRIENGMKEGLWVEYSIDSSLMKLNISYKTGDHSTAINGNAILHKSIGNYSKNNKEGIWKLFESFDKKTPYYWNEKSSTNYLNDKKDGEEITYMGFGKDKEPLIILNWKRDTLNGICKIWDANYSHKLINYSIAIMGKVHTIEAYYQNGQTMYKNVNTTIKGKQGQMCYGYYESGKLKSKCFYFNDEPLGQYYTYLENGKIESIANYEDGKLNGDYKYYYDNGQLWTEEIFKNDNLMEILSNYNKKGKLQEKGSIKNGTGTVYNYDSDGKLLAIYNYIDGKQQK